MAVTTITQQKNLTFLQNMLSVNAVKGKKTVRAIAFSLTQNMLDTFQNSTRQRSIQNVVWKMQTALNAPAARPKSDTTVLQGQPVNPVTREDIDLAVYNYGGRDALNPWLVDGRTKIVHDGRSTVVAVDENPPSENYADPRDAALAALARFDLTGEHLDSGSDAVRASLRQAAREKSAETPNLASAIEYALEDAFAKVSAWENGGAANTAGADASSQLDINLRQAREVLAQLNLDGGADWGVESLARDLAVFGLDLTAMNGNPYELTETIRDKSLEMLADLDSRYVGTEQDYLAARRQITGASSRLVHGLGGSGGAVAVAVGASVSASTVSVGGVNVNASAIIAVGNVIVDPLVLDLNGDGIGLKGADEGVAFDMNGDGEKRNMGFIRGDDALLFVDTHGDGLVRDGRQLFGNVDGHANGFDKLRSFDENGDGVIDENDAIYDQLRLWVEKNENGVCEEGETMSLREAGITSINLGYQNVREDDGKGNLIGQIGSFTRADGSSGLAADVWLQESGE